MHVSFNNDFGPVNENTWLGTHLDVYRARYRSDVNFDVDYR